MLMLMIQFLFFSLFMMVHFICFWKSLIDLTNNEEIKNILQQEIQSSKIINK